VRNLLCTCRMMHSEMDGGDSHIVHIGIESAKRLSVGWCEERCITAVFNFYLRVGLYNLSEFQAKDFEAAETECQELKRATIKNERRSRL